MAAASLVLYLVFTGRHHGRWRGASAGAPPPWSPASTWRSAPRFLTVFSLNCVGQYVDVLALGGAGPGAPGAPARRGRPGRRRARGATSRIGVLLGAAFWQQPVALSYVAVVAAGPGAAARDLARSVDAARARGLASARCRAALERAERLGQPATSSAGSRWSCGRRRRRCPAWSRRTLTSRSRSWPGSARAIPGRTCPACARRRPGSSRCSSWRTWCCAGRTRGVAARARGPSPAVLAPLLLAVLPRRCSGPWPPARLLAAALPAAGRGRERGARWASRCAWVWARSRPRRSRPWALVLALNVAGTLPRLADSAGHRRPSTRPSCASLEREGHPHRLRGLLDRRAGDHVHRRADRALAAPGPHAGLRVRAQARRVAEDGPDAFVLLPEDDPERFAAALRGLGRVVPAGNEPVTVFYGLSRRVRLEEVAGFRGPQGRHGRPARRVALAPPLQVLQLRRSAAGGRTHPCSWHATCFSRGRSRAGAK